MNGNNRDEIEKELCFIVFVFICILAVSAIFYVVLQAL